MRHDELIADAVEASGGSLIKSMGEGDSTVSVFDSAPAAVEAALAANRALAAEQWPPGIRIAARWGIHTGEAERRDADYFGPSVILAARVRAQADGGEILISSVTSELVAAHLPEGCSLVDLGPHRLKGLGAPERIHALAGPGVGTPPSGNRVPVPRPARVRARRPRLLLRPRRGRGEDHRALAPGRLLAVVGASGSGKSSVLRAGVVAAVRAGEVDGLRHASLLTPGAAPALDARRRAGSTRRRRPVRGAVHRCATTRSADGRSSTRYWGCAAPSRSEYAPTSTADSAGTASSRSPSPTTRCCSGRWTAASSSARSPSRPGSRA